MACGLVGRVSHHLVAGGLRTLERQAGERRTGRSLRGPRITKPINGQLNLWLDFEASDRSCSAPAFEPTEATGDPNAFVQFSRVFRRLRPGIRRAGVSRICVG